jgi:hypothetical protein
MFQHEDMGSLFSKMDPLTLANSSRVHYTRGSFASVLRLVKDSVKSDWNKMMDILLCLVEDDSTILMGRTYIQELYLKLHLLGVHTVPTFSPSFNQRGHGRGAIGLRAWKHIPEVICITLKVPRDKLKAFTSLPLKELGTPIVHCILQSAAASSPWQNIFSAVQLSFGTVVASGSRTEDDFQIHVAEDESGWKGRSPLFASFYAPTWVTMLQPETTTIAFGVQSTPQSVMAFTGSLGIQMNVYETTLVDEDNVYITKYRPNQSRYPSLSTFRDADMKTDYSSKGDVRMAITANVDQKTAKIMTLTGRVDVLSEKARAALRDQCQVDTVQISPCVIAVVLGKSLTQHCLHFPAPVLNSKSKTRIARK